MTSPSIVRPAVPEDRAELIRLFHEAHAENAMFELADDKLDYYLNRALFPQKIPAGDSGPRGLIGVIGNNASLEAMIMLVLGSVWYSDTITLQDALNFVDTKHRRSNHARALIAYAKYLTDKVRENNKDFRLMVGVVSTHRTAAKLRLYERMQLTPVGCYYLYPVPDDFVPLKHQYRS